MPQDPRATLIFQGLKFRVLSRERAIWLVEKVHVFTTAAASKQSGNRFGRMRKWKRDPC